MSKEEYHYVFKQIGDNIRKAREAKRLSQEELAFLINSARNYIGCRKSRKICKCDYA